MNELTVGLALGKLSTRGTCSVWADGEWVKIEALTVAGEKTLTLDQVFLILDAEEVRV